ncbi:hypothetical protein RP20_CCG006922 [Aedes albopictus]|nr:hypothetical protein RP20_CCG006922 [Aedes albopictus]
MPMKEEDEQYTVVGWGETELGNKSPNLLEVTVTGRHISMCNEVFRKHGIALSKTQLCVGGEEGKDSCRGDSGGPLMRRINDICHRIRFNEWDTTKKASCTIKNDVEICRAEYEIEKAFPHPLYHVYDPNMRHDIGLLKTKTDVEINDFVKPVCLPISEIIRQLPIDQQEFVVTGWGQTDQGTPGLQRHVTVIGQNKSVCDKAFDLQRIVLSKDQLCIGGSIGQDSCRGDSGGPLTREHELVNYLIGVVSFGAYKCGTRNHPGVYTNVGNYLDWIEETLISNSP